MLDISIFISRFTSFAFKLVLLCALLHFTMLRFCFTYINDIEAHKIDYVEMKSINCSSHMPVRPNGFRFVFINIRVFVALDWRHRCAVSSGADLVLLRFANGQSMCVCMFSFSPSPTVCYRSILLGFVCFAALSQLFRVSHFAPQCYHGGVSLVMTWARNFCYVTHTFHHNPITDAVDSTTIGTLSAHSHTIELRWKTTHTTIVRCKNVELNIREIAHLME